MRVLGLTQVRISPVLSHSPQTDRNVFVPSSRPTLVFDISTQYCGLRMVFSRRSFLISPRLFGGRRYTIDTGGTRTTSIDPFIGHIGNGQGLCWL